MMVEIRLLVINSKPEPTTLVLEPWADEYVLQPSEEMALVYRGPEDGAYPEVSIEEERIVVWGWTGSVVTPFKDGVNLDATSERPAVPSFPSSVKQDHSSNLPGLDT